MYFGGKRNWHEMYRPTPEQEERYRKVMDAILAKYDKKRKEENENKQAKQ